jgi:hypothetical protein
MRVKKRFFPNNSKRTKPRVRSANRTINRNKLHSDKSYGTGRNLREEFDRMMTEKHTLISDDQRRQLWATVSARMLEYPTVSLQEHIDSIHI